MSVLLLPDWLDDGLEPTGAVQVTQDVCEWTPVENGFDSACGQPWEWHDHGRAGQHPWNYCACCGRPVKIVEAEQ